MGWFNTNLSKVIDNVNKMNNDYLTMIANFETLETSYEKFEKRTEKEIDKIKEDNENIHRRLTTVEGDFKSIIKTSTETAIIKVLKDHLDKNGNIINDNETIEKLLREKQNPEN